MDVTFVQNPEHNAYTHCDRHNQQDAHIAHGILKDFGRTLEGPRDRGGESGGRGSFDVASCLPERGAWPERKGDGDGRQLAGMRNALRAGIGHQTGHCPERHHVAGVALQVDQVQAIAMLLEFRQHFQQDAVLIGRSVNCGSELRAEGVVERTGDVLPVEVEGGGTVAVKDDVDARRLDLQVADHILQARHARAMIRSSLGASA